MADQPFVTDEERPNLTVNMEGKVGDMTVRDLASILGADPAAPKPLKEPIDKAAFKEIAKDNKDRKEAKEAKDHKEPKDHKDQKEQKDHKDPKEQKDQKDQKEHKDQKDTKDQKDHKDPKEHKDQKDQKDHKEHKETAKDVKDALKEIKEHAEKIDIEGPVTGAPAAAGETDLDALIQRVTGLEQSVNELKGRKKA
jgi:hypothetical protein